MGRRLTVRLAAWGLRHGVTLEQMAETLTRTHWHRGSPWLWDVIGDAYLLNDRKQVRRDYKAWRQGA